MTFLFLHIHLYPPTHHPYPPSAEDFPKVYDKAIELVLSLLNLYIEGFKVGDVYVL